MELLLVRHYIGPNSFFSPLAVVYGVAEQYAYMPYSDRNQKLPAKGRHCFNVFIFCGVAYSEYFSAI